MYVASCFSWSEAALIRSNQCFDEGSQSFTQYEGKNLIYNREKAYISVVGGYVLPFSEQDRTENTETPISGYTLFRHTL